MSYFLAKTEPAVYSIDRLQAEQETIWNGVRNPQAVRAIRSMRPDDRVFIYHSGGVSAIAGLAAVASEPADDPEDPKSALVRFRYLGHIEPPVKLSEIKSSGLFSDWELVRQSRLSTMAVPPSFVAWMRKRYPQIDI